MDFALTVGSPFTVGVADEDRDTASRTEMVDAPERVHKMAATPEPAPSQELAESAPEPAPSQELAESAGPAQLSFVSAGPAQLIDASAGSVQFYRVPPRGSGVHQELSWKELPSIAHGDPGPAMAHEVP